jgi:hypothetical protein
LLKAASAENWHKKAFQETGRFSMDRGEWYFNVGYVELAYASLVIAIFVALHFFARLKRVFDLSFHASDEKGILLGLLGLAIVLFIINRVLGDLW